MYSVIERFRIESWNMQYSSERSQDYSAAKQGVRLASFVEADESCSSQMFWELLLEAKRLRLDLTANTERKYHS